MMLFEQAIQGLLVMFAVAFIISTCIQRKGYPVLLTFLIRFASFWFAVAAGYQFGIDAYRGEKRTVEEEVLN